MATLFNQITDVLAGEAVEAIRLEPITTYREPRNHYGGNHYAGYEDLPFGKVLTWEEAVPHLQSEFDDGYGTQECPSFTLWTATRVLSLHEYDGATWVASICRNPEPITYTWDS